MEVIIFWTLASPFLLGMAAMVFLAVRAKVLEMRDPEMAKAVREGQAVLASLLPWYQQSGILPQSRQSNSGPSQPEMNGSSSLQTGRGAQGAAQELPLQSNGQGQGRKRKRNPNRRTTATTP